jgi:Secretion system C-terminal sorting domain
MKKALFIICIFCTFKAFAQPTFNAVDLNPVFGDVFTRVALDSTGIVEGPSGANQIWNFNVILNPLDRDTATFVATSLIPSIGAFPLANIANKQTFGSSVEYQLYNASSNAYEFLGNISIDSLGNIDTTAYLSPLSQYVYPFTYQSAFVDSTATAPINVGLFTSTIKYNRAVLADAYGDLTINNQLFSNVLRLNYKDTFTVDVVIFQAKIVIDAYQWFKQGYKDPLLTIVKSSDGQSPEQKSVSLNGNLPLSVLNTIKENQVSVYPNPVVNELKINNGFKTETNYTIKDLSGKIMLEAKLNQVSKSIDVKRLDKGMYILEMKSKDKTLLKKIIKN